MEAARDDVLAFLHFPQEHWCKIWSTKPLERLNKEIKRRTNVIGIFPNDAAITCLVGNQLLAARVMAAGAPPLLLRGHQCLYRLIRNSSIAELRIHRSAFIVVRWS